MPSETDICQPLWIVINFLFMLPSTANRIEMQKEGNDCFHFLFKLKSNTYSNGKFKGKRFHFVPILSFSFLKFAIIISSSNNHRTWNYKVKRSKKKSLTHRQIFWTMTWLHGKFTNVSFWIVFLFFFFFRFDGKSKSRKTNCSFIDCIFVWNKRKKNIGNEKRKIEQSLFIEYIISVRWYERTWNHFIVSFVLSFWFFFCFPSMNCYWLNVQVDSSWLLGRILFVGFRFQKSEEEKKNSIFKAESSVKCDQNQKRILLFFFVVVAGVAVAIAIASAKFSLFFGWFTYFATKSK